LKSGLYRTGFWSSIILTITVIGFALLILIGKITGMDTNYYSFIDCFFIAPAFVAFIIANYYLADEHKRVFGHIGIALAIIYAVFITMVYYLQVTVVYNDNMHLSNEVLKLLKFTPGTALFAIDILGYSFMGLATLFSAFVFGSTKLEKWIKGIMIFNGFSFVGLIYPMLQIGQDGVAKESSGNFGIIMYIVWCSYFAALTVLTAIYYKRKIDHIN